MNLDIEKISSTSQQIWRSYLIRLSLGGDTLYLRGIGAVGTTVSPKAIVKLIVN